MGRGLRLAVAACAALLPWPLPWPGISLGSGVDGPPSLLVGAVKGPGGMECHTPKVIGRGSKSRRRSAEDSSGADDRMVYTWHVIFSRPKLGAPFALHGAFRSFRPSLF
jgi:hypothetical protein